VKAGIYCDAAQIVTITNDGFYTDRIGGHGTTPSDVGRFEAPQRTPQVKLRLRL
jgi:hypothetical protein